MNEVRAFIAIELPEALKQRLEELVNRLRNQGPPGVKWVKPDGIHLTIKFLGNVPPDSLAGISGAVAESAKGIAPICLRAENLGVFPNPRRTQVIWVGVGGEVDRLISLQKRLETNLARLGFTPEARPFSPHLTLARLGDRMPPEERERLGKFITTCRFEAAAFTADGLSLMRSELRRDGAIYSRLSLITLVGSGSVNHS